MMEITQYTFQSPYPQQVQIKQRDISSEQRSLEGESITLATESNQTMRHAKALVFQQQQQQNSATVAGRRFLDLYA